jgi:hypothetical protein
MSRGVYRMNIDLVCKKDCRHIKELEKQNKMMIDALKLFVTRVEMGEVRSKKTYSQFKEIIEECEK